MYFVILVTLFVFSIMNEYFCNQKIEITMTISQKTIEKLRELINEETEYRSRYKLVAFFQSVWI